MEHYNKTHKIRKFLRNVTIGGTLAGLLVAGNCTKEYETFSDTYQGWTRDNGKIVYVFDPKDFNERHKNNNSSPRYKIIGDNSLRYSLKIGEEYFVTVENSHLPWDSKKISSIKKESNYLTGGKVK